MSNTDIEPVVARQLPNIVLALETSEPLWVTIIKENKYLNEDSDYENTIAPDIAELFKSYLLSEDHNAAAATAIKFDSMYEEVYVPKYNGCGESGRKKWWTGYLSYFYEAVFVITKHISYDDPLQDKVVHLLLELKKLPSRSAKIGSYRGWEWIDSVVWQCDPQFTGQLQHAHDCSPPSLCRYIHPFPTNAHADCPSPVAAVKDYLRGSYDDEDYVEAAQEYELDPIRWVNHHAFRARCILAGLCEGDEGFLDGPTAAIDYGLRLERERSSQKVADATVIAAANYIIMIGDIIDSECVRKQQTPYRDQWRGWRDGNGPTVWKQWARRLSEILEGLEKGDDAGLHVREKNRAVLRDLATKARARMEELEPALIIEMEAERRQQVRKKLEEEENKKKEVEEKQKREEAEEAEKAENIRRTEEAEKAQEAKEVAEESAPGQTPAAATDSSRKADSTADGKSDADSDLKVTKTSEPRHSKHRAVEFVKGLVRSFSSAGSKKEAKQG
ncbi:hypothetical protein QBC40DRAFT_277246 [Triangularia verruculosa]|uniref:Uncharacterized protein n=1 Tax=Triangularia verruculosa TaxID=2587418 RepID=A0AAN6XLW9_9PEZI|nr:hypothetical protein QBC40DRAFT_277246 [Triangularia verruculosa]